MTTTATTTYECTTGLTAGSARILVTVSGPSPADLTIAGTPVTAPAGTTTTYQLLELRSDPEGTTYAMGPVTDLTASEPVPITLAAGVIRLPLGDILTPCVLTATAPPPPAEVGDAATLARTGADSLALLVLALTLILVGAVLAISTRTKVTP